jgi:predicted peptidase
MKKKPYKLCPVLIITLFIAHRSAFLFCGGFMIEKNLPQSHGIYEKSLTLKNGEVFRYTLSLPDSFLPEKKVPLVVALHFGGEVTPWYGKGYLTILVEPAWFNLGAIIVAPDCPTPVGWDNPRSETAVIALVDHMKQYYNIDEKKIVLTGFSLGGIGTWYLASRHPHLFSAAVPMSSMPKADVLESLGDVPYYVIHSTGDEIFPIKKVEELIGKIKARGMDVQFKALDGVSHYRTASFVKALREAVPWILNIWENKKSQ